MLDCLVIGGGPAGLTAAIYLARFHLSVTVIDAGRSRAALIPLTHNHAGYPDGIAGVDLLDRMREQARAYGATVLADAVATVAHGEPGFVARCGLQEFPCRTILLATGVVNRRPTMMDHAIHDEALATGRLRYCPICDGYEVTDMPVAVLGTGQRGCDEAVFLRSYTSSVTLAAPEQGHNLSNSQLQTLSDAGIAIAGRVSAIRLAQDGIILDVPGGTRTFVSLYPALGTDIRSELARQIGARCSEEGCLTVDSHQRTSVPGLYAAGDVVLGLDQISHAMGEGGVAATTIRNDLAALTPLRR